MKKLGVVIWLCTAIVSVFLYFAPKVNAQRGCCSWHGGVAGCSNGRQLCSDGTLSSSCTCYSEPVDPWVCKIGDKKFYSHLSAQTYWYNNIDESVKSVYKSLLLRDTNDFDIQYWHSQFPYNNCSGSSWSYKTITDQVINSEERKTVLAKIEADKQARFVASKATIEVEDMPEEKPDYSDLYAIGGLFTIIGFAWLWNHVKTNE